MTTTETKPSAQTTVARRTPCELWFDTFAKSSEPRYYALPIDEGLPAYILVADTEEQARAECEFLGIELVA